MVMNHAAAAGRQTPWGWMLLATCAVTAATALLGPPLAVLLIKLAFAR